MNKTCKNAKMQKNKKKACRGRSAKFWEIVLTSFALFKYLTFHVLMSIKHHQHGTLLLPLGSSARHHPLSLRRCFPWTKTAL